MTPSPLSRNQLWYGRDEPLAEPRQLRAGPLSLVLDGLDLRYLTLGGVELVRRLYVAVRDHNWDTIPGTATHVEVAAGAGHFTVRFEVRHRQRDVAFSWQGRITGTADGTISYAMDGVAGAAFRYNRIGFCVLHPPRTAAGRPYRGATPDGAISGTLPLLIGPQRSVEGTLLALFPAVSSLTIDATDDLAVRFDFAGDLFEMEDQRNWTDNSFKTYCTPLAQPWPKQAHGGQRIVQSVTIAATGAAMASAKAETTPPATANERRVTLGTALARALPPIGLGMASHGGDLSARELELLRPLRLGHLRADLHLGDPAYVDELDRAVRACAALGCGLELAVFVTGAAEHELAELAARLQSDAPVVRFLVLHEQEQTTAGRWVRLARERLGPVAPTVPFAGGTNVYFADLNRNRPEVEDMDAVCYAVTPQVHAFDEASLIEAVEAQADTVRTAQSFCAGRAIAVGPITLRPRFNPDATGPEPAPVPGELPSQVDPRQMSLFAAAWTLGSIKYLAESGAASLTYYETTGWRGVMETEEGAPLPERFPSRPGMVYPLYHVLRDLAECRPGTLLECLSADTLAVEALAVRDADDRVHVLLANVTPQEQRVVLGPLPTDVVAMRLLDEDSAAAALFEPERFRATMKPVSMDGNHLRLHLRPYAVTHIIAGSQPSA